MHVSAIHSASASFAAYRSLGVSPISKTFQQICYLKRCLKKGLPQTSQASKRLLCIFRPLS